MSNSKQKYVIVDIDGTIADVRHRLHHIQGTGRKNWKAFFEEMDRDTTIPGMIERVHDLGSRYRIIFVTGRPEHYRARTETWLRKHGLAYDKLFMRSSGDHRPDYISKSEVLHEIDPNEIVLALDDRPPVCAMWRKYGIHCELVESDEQNQAVNELYREKPEGAPTRNGGRPKA